MHRKSVFISLHYLESIYQHTKSYRGFSVPHCEISSSGMLRKKSSIKFRLNRYNSHLIKIISSNFLSCINYGLSVLFG